MDNVKIGVLLTLFLLAFGFGVYLNQFKIPRLEKQLDDFANTPPRVEIETIPGKIDTVFVRDTVTVYRPQSGDPVLVEQVEKLEEQLEMAQMEMKNPPVKKYETAFSDSVVDGTIYNTIIGEGYLSNAEITYRFNRPIYMTQRIDTVIVTETKTLVRFKPEPRPWRMQVGLFGGASPNPDMNVYLGPTAGFLTPKDV